jgi:hypothetical protein
VARGHKQDQFFPGSSISAGAVTLQRNRLGPDASLNA